MLLVVVQQSKHNVKQGFVDPIIGLGVPSSSSPIDPKMVENTPIFNSNPKKQHCLDHVQESKTKSQEWDKLIANKKSVIKIILDQCDEDIRGEIALGPSYENNFKAEEPIEKPHESTQGL